MKNELLELEKLLHDCIVPLLNKSDENEPFHPELCLSQFKAATSRIKKSLVTEVFSLHSDNHINLYIQCHQNAIISFIDELLGLAMEKAADNEGLSVMINAAIAEAEELLTYIETYFPQHFNLDERVPASYQQVSENELEHKMQLLSGGLDENIQCPQLKSICALPFQELKQQKHFTFRQLMYCKKLMDGLLESLQESVKDKDCTIRHRLLYYNFNSHHYFDYLTRLVADDINNRTSENSQLESLHHFLKIINQAQVKPNYAYKPKQPSIKERAHLWLTEEISFLEKKRQWAIVYPQTSTDELSEDCLFQSQVPVAVLSFLFRLLIESEFIKVENTVQIFKILSSVFVSMRHEKISTDSLKNKFYNADPNSKAAMKVWLQKWQNLSRKL